MTRQHIRLTLMVLVTLVIGREACAQFGTPGSTSFRERIVGDVRGGDEDITPESGDQVGAFFQDEIVGVFTYTSDDPGFSVTIFGDDPMTEEAEGPTRNDRVEFRYFDSSTNQTLDLAVLNQQGEVFNYTWQGSQVLEVPGLPIDLTPTRQFDLRAGGPSDGGGGGGGDGGGGDTPGGGTDINGDGETDVKDAAVILRALGGAVRPGSRAFMDLGIMITDPAREVSGDGIRLSAEALLGRCDVNGDGVVSSSDAVIVLRARQ